MPSWTPRAGRAALLALLAAACWYADHPGRLSYGAFLGRYLLLLVAGAALLFSLLWVRQRTFAAEVPRFGLPPRLRLLAVAGLVAAVLCPLWLVAPLHLTHPVAALALAWLGAPAALRLVERLRARAAWPGLAMAIIRHAPLVLFAVLLLFLFAQSYRRHLWFGSGGKDLGLFTQSIWLLSRGAAPDNTLLGMHAFGDHLELIDLLVVPLVWVWPDPGALLLFQAACVAFGAVAVFDLARKHLGGQAAGVAVALAYVFAVDMQNAVMFDWNPTTCGAGLLPWVVWTYERGQLFGFAFFLLLVAACKENLVLYALALCLVLAFEQRHARRRAFAAAAVLAVLFVVEMKVLFPRFRPEGGFRHLRYQELGQSAGEIVTTVLTRPLFALQLLWTPAAKVDGLLAPLSSVAFAAALAPRWLLALAPMVLERFWSTHQNRWWGFYYGAGASTVAVLGSIYGLRRLSERLGEARRPLLATAIAGLLLATLLVALDVRRGASLLRWRQPYFTTSADRADAEAVLALIPPDASVAAQNHLIPHLSARREIYELHRPVRAQYVALDVAQSAWPYDKRYVRVLGRELLAGGYGIVGCAGEAVVLERGAPSRSDCSGFGATLLADVRAARQ